MKSLAASLLAICLCHVALAAPPQQLTTDGRLKRDPVISKPDGSELIYVLLEKPISNSMERVDDLRRALNLG